jgi:hypothetical protein
MLIKIACYRLSITWATTIVYKDQYRGGNITMLFRCLRGRFYVFRNKSKTYLFDIRSREVEHLTIV